MVFGKTRTFVFREIGMLWSSLQIKFPNLRFEDFYFLRIFVNISRTKKFSAENVFVRPKIFLFGTNIFCLYYFNVFFFGKKQTENCSKWS